MMKRISKAAAAAGLSLLASGCATFSQQKALTEKVSPVISSCDNVRPRRTLPGWRSTQPRPFSTARWTPLN